MSATLVGEPWTARFPSVVLCSTITIFRLCTVLHKNSSSLTTEPGSNSPWFAFSTICVASIACMKCVPSERWTLNLLLVPGFPDAGASCLRSVHCKTGLKSVFPAQSAEAAFGVSGGPSITSVFVDSLSLFLSPRLVSSRDTAPSSTGSLPLPLPPVVSPVASRSRFARAENLVLLVLFVVFSFC